MNPAHFPNPGGNMSGVPKPGMQPPKNENAQVIMSHVAQALQSQGQYGGWKGEVPIKTRAMNVYQMITSLRLIQPRIDIHTAAQAALSFEQKAFQKATERADYEKECNEKLLHIKDTRQRQAAVAMQTGMMPQAGAMQTPIQGGFPPQMNRAIQSSPVPGQPQMGMGIADANQQAALQRQQQSAMLQEQQQQRAQQRPGNGSALPDDLHTLSPQELEHVSRLASQMLAKTSPEDMEKIKMNLANMNPEQRSYLARKNMDPMTYFFRSQALNQLRRHRRARMEMGRASNAGMDPSNTMMADPMMNQRQLFHNMMNFQRNSALVGQTGQGLENAFIGNVENIQGQQADGLRSQEAGQLVVPASSSQMNQQPFPNQQNMFPQQMGQTNQPNMNSVGVNPQLFSQSQLQGGSNGPQDRMQFTQQNPAQVQAQARAQAAQKAQLAMSGHTGQANAQAQAQAHLGQSSPVMPMLNQPMAPAQMSPVQVSAQARPPSRAPNMGQHPAGVPGVAQPPLQGRPQIPPGLPQAVQDHLNQMSNEQLQAFMMNQRRTVLANNMARANAAQQTGSLQQSVSQPGQNQQIFSNQLANNSRMRNSISMAQGVNLTGSSQPQQLQGQQLTPQQRAQQQQRQNELYKLHILRQHNNGMEMTAEQGKEMDRASFPPSILGNNPSLVPKHIKTWGQLKQWVVTNPQITNGLDLQKLLTVQKLHFAQILAAQAKDPNNQGQGVLTQSFPGAQSQVTNGPNFPSGQPQAPAGMPPMRPITAQDIQVARQKLGPQAQNFSDDQMRDFLRNRQRQILMQAAQNRAQMTGNLPPGQNQSIPQPVVTGPQASGQVKPAAIPHQPQVAGDQQSSNAKIPSGAAVKGLKAPPGKGASKKKPNADEPGATNTPQQPHPAPLPNNIPSKVATSLTQEQFAAMNPQQRLQVEAQMRKQQQSLLRGPLLTKAAAEEAWNNNVPPRIMEVYNEIAKNAPPTKPVPVSQEQKAIMAQQLRDSVDILGRLDALVLHGFGKMQGQEKNVKNLLVMRIQLMRQFKPGPDWIVNDNFTISPEYLAGAIVFIRKLFQVMIARMNQQRPNANQASATGAQPPSSNTAALNATNLQQLQQQQEEAVQHARRASSQSAAVAPAPFGAPSPQGVPHAYGPGGLAPEKLKLPPPKRRKPSQAGIPGSPVQSSAQIAAQTAAAAARYKQAVSNAKSTAAALTGAFKCSIVECQHHYQGFPTQAALDKHVEENHQPEEEDNVDDPLQYYIDSIDIGLGLATDGQQNPAAATSSPAAAHNQLNAVPSPVRPSIATPVTASAAPMAPAMNQAGTKTASPAPSAHRLTPNLVSGKISKHSPIQSNKKQLGKRTFDEMEAKDPWSNCPISLEALHDSLAPTFADCQRKGLGYDPFDEFMNSDMFGQDQTENTPDSWDIGLATLTPKDEIKGDIKGGVLWADWMPWDEESIAANIEWMQIPPELLDTREPFEGAKVDWERLKQQQKETKLVNGGIAIAAL